VEASTDMRETRTSEDKDGPLETTRSRSKEDTSVKLKPCSQITESYTKGPRKLERKFLTESSIDDFLDIQTLLPRTIPVKTTELGTADSRTD
jgi:hypothetical protein